VAYNIFRNQTQRYFGYRCAKIRQSVFIVDKVQRQNYIMSQKRHHAFIFTKYSPFFKLTDTIPRKFAIKLLLKISPHLKRVATYEILLLEN